MATIEIVYTWPSGREEVRYRRPWPSKEGEKLKAQAERLPCYSSRIVGDEDLLERDIRDAFAQLGRSPWQRWGWGMRIAWLFALYWSVALLVYWMRSPELTYMQVFLDTPRALLWRAP